MYHPLLLICKMKLLFMGFADEDIENLFKVCHVRAVEQNIPIEAMVNILLHRIQEEEIR